MNSVIIMGRLTKDPEVRYTQGENAQAVANFTIAVDRAGKKDEADFIRCQTWGKRAEFAEKYLHKGTKVAASGRLQTGSYKDKNGDTVYTWQVVLNDIEFAESKAQNANAAAPVSNDGSNNAAAPVFNNDFMDIPDTMDELLPFA